VPAAKWLTADVMPVMTHDGIYDSGFHCFPDPRAAAEWVVYGQVIRRVKVRNITTRGTQDGLPVLVAQEMFVPEEP